MAHCLGDDEPQLVSELAVDAVAARRRIL